MKKTSYMLVLMLVFLVPASAMANDAAVSGFVLNTDVFYTLESELRQAALDRPLKSANLTDTITLFFDGEISDHLLPNLALIDTQTTSLAEDVPSMVEMVQGIVTTLQTLQASFPDAFLFNTEMVAPYIETGVSVMVGGAEIWLWAQNGLAVMLPLYFASEENGAMLDNPYLLTLVTTNDNGSYYTLYNDPNLLMQYVAQVEFSSEGSDFQHQFVVWYLSVHMNGSGDETKPATTGNLQEENMQDKPEEGKYLGTVTVKAPSSANVRAAADTGSDVVEVVKNGHRYNVLSIAENGWYEIELRDGRTGFIAPSLVIFHAGG